VIGIIEPRSRCGQRMETAMPIKMENARITSYQIGGSLGDEDAPFIFANTTPDDEAAHSGGVNVLMGDGSVRFALAPTQWDHCFEMPQASTGEGKLLGNLLTDAYRVAGAWDGDGRDMIGYAVAQDIGQPDLLI
jgi:prepilin-type processing-associated H-X9-DG protein